MGANGHHLRKDKTMAKVRRPDWKGLAKLLIKAGYTVRIVALKVGNTTVKGVEANEPPR